MSSQCLGHQQEKNPCKQQENMPTPLSQDLLAARWQCSPLSQCPAHGSNVNCRHTVLYTIKPHLKDSLVEKWPAVHYNDLMVPWKTLKAAIWKCQFSFSTEKLFSHFEHAHRGTNLHVNVMQQLKNKDKSFDKCHTINTSKRCSKYVMTIHESGLLAMSFCTLKQHKPVSLPA